MPTYVETIAKRLKDKMVEIYLGDEFEQVSFADNNTNVFSVICGRIIDGEGDCLVLDSIFIEKHTKRIKTGNIIYVNSNNIRAITELNGNGTFRDCILSVDDSPALQPGGKHGVK